MAEKAGAVTPERFASGLTYEDYAAQVKVNKDRLQQYYATARLTAGDREFFRKASEAPGGVCKVLVLSEDWSPDCYRGVPVIARVAGTAGLEMRIFYRDQNQDIMNEFLKDGQFMSIPVVAFYTRDLRYICRWTERPEAATRERMAIEAEIRKTQPDITKEALRPIMGERTKDRFPAWQQETVREIRQLLAGKLGLS